MAPLLPPAKPGGRARTTSLRGVLDAVFHLRRTDCRWRLLPDCFPPWGTVYHDFRLWQRTGLWVRLHRAAYALARAAAGRCARLRWTQAARGRKRHILVDTLGLPIASRVEPADVPDQKAGAQLLAGLRPLFPAIRTVMADAGHQSRKLTRALRQHEGWRLVITKRGQRAFKIKGLTWIVKRSRRFSKDYEFKVQTSETLIEIAATRLMLNRIAPR